MKTIEELNALKSEFEAVTGKLEGLTDEELVDVCGGWGFPWPIDPSYAEPEELVKIMRFAREAPEKFLKTMKLVKEAPDEVAFKDSAESGIAF